ncbi:V-type ATP synthase subunit A [Treponema saccharophilum]|uniref:V-type ATP synthase alpha chain n=1 Tax=Treponema saccharophilum DSM 2985 TaxID=907348 RepID=H7EMM1_9SPIR|nr:V-type ATP synthase subunit A [Treponema saccharophilum]EIC01306.1 H+transporting two-sector ATPase alpha/beta subunit central region [Treponema saccharophilum DSM 2985]BDC96061.1 V-type ATP synthase alpha chain [Treponema saccharophilum]
MTDTKGKVVGVNGNMVSVEFDGVISMNEVAYVKVEGSSLKSEVIRIRGNTAQMQVYEMTKGIKAGDEVEFTGDLLSAELGPGLLGQVYDGLQNPLPLLAEKAGWFLERGIYVDPLDREKKWDFTPTAKVGDVLKAGEYVGTVPEGPFTHKIFVPFYLLGSYTVKSVAEKGSYMLKDTVAVITDEKGNDVNVTLSFKWPVKRAVNCYEERLAPTETMVTKVRLIDTFFPVARGGTYCIPGPFGAGKTVLQHTTSKYADVDIVIIAACGERAGEVVETLTEFPELKDPKTGKSLMERTIIICNTSSMPVASREASVYTSVTLAEYYRQMGLNVLLLADSTSRWAQALREMSGRLEEIPGEEAFPAYMESYIAAFYERAGQVRLSDGTTGSVTIGGTVSPAGGNFEEPVTQATLKVVGAFHGLSRARSDARKYPAIDPIQSWSKYKGVISQDKVGFCFNILKKGVDVGSMMKVVGEEGTSLDDYLVYLKEEMLDAVYFQQNSFDAIDANATVERQMYDLDKLLRILGSDFAVSDKEEARTYFNQLRQKFIDWNYTEFQSDGFKKLEKEIDDLYASKNGKLTAEAESLLRA